MSGAVHSSPAHRLLLANLPTSLPLAALRAGLLARLVPPAAILDLRLLPAGAEAGTATALLALDSAAAADTVLAALHLTPPLNLRVVPAGAQGERVARRVEGVARAAVNHGDMEVQVKVEAKEEIKEDIVNTENGVEIQAEEIGNKEEIMDVEEEEVFNFGELVVVEEELGECSGCGALRCWCAGAVQAWPPPTAPGHARSPSGPATGPPVAGGRLHRRPRIFLRRSLKWRKKWWKR